MDRFRNTGQPDWDWWGRLWPTPGETLRDLGVASGDSLAEIGSGNGYFALPAARIVDPATVYALDVDEALLAELSTLADRAGIANVEPIHGDARRLHEHLPGPVDVCLLANAFHGIAEPDPFVEAVADALAPGGRFVVVNWMDRPREETTVAGEPRGPPTELRLSPAETERRIAGASDFRTARRVDLPPYHYALVLER
ncbi:class I SAM-dependent methyltransferase [Halobaculum rubrum]|uniref:class I SAM-dependent methyltransferase n=1 Tax=Halobaculum rubrum TaxID=2872158 RepID=UPI001CA3F50A|nr:class I SAM-dependent methyltransferase [Halobaculum rubrum]QZX98241.1 class I SAM-dependent methyltransferase [Halobaculum rubrum]